MTRKTRSVLGEAALWTSLLSFSSAVVIVVVWASSGDTQDVRIPVAVLLAVAGLAMGVGALLAPTSREEPPT